MRLEGASVQNISPIRPSVIPTLPASVRPAEAGGGEPRDLVMRPVQFQPELKAARSLFARAGEPAPGKVAYYDAAADATDRSKYYGDLPTRMSSMDGKKLYAALNQLVTSTHKPLGYDPEQHLYPWVDRRPSLQLDSVYSDKADNGKQAADPGGLWILAEGEGPSTMVWSEKERKIFNCEHVVPQSWFEKQSTPRADLHHLFTCDIDCNSLRGNSVYSDFLAGQGESFPSCGITDHNRKNFEPYGGKGAVARAVLYFLIRYPGKVGDERNEYSAKDLDMLKEWARENPVGEYERHRNRAIQQKQGNRNPLVDFPELVDRIDFAQGLGRV